MHAEIKITGVVQGVGFRPFIYRIATANNLKGYVRNRGDAGVEIVVEGREHDVKHFLNDLKEKKPPIACIYKILIQYSKKTGTFTKFTILKSSETKELAGSVVPPDISLCDECLKELRNPENPRHNFCRFSIISPQAKLNCFQMSTKLCASFRKISCLP